MSKKTCSNGHTFFKTSDCPTCPECERTVKPTTGIGSVISAPARRALENAGIHSPEQLTNWSVNELLQLHGIGKTSIPKLEQYLADHQLTFKKN